MLQITQFINDRVKFLTWTLYESTFYLPSKLHTIFPHIHSLILASFKSHLCYYHAQKPWDSQKGITNWEWLPRSCIKDKGPQNLVEKKHFNCVTSKCIYGITKALSICLLHFVLKCCFKCEVYYTKQQLNKC